MEEKEAIKRTKNSLKAGKSKTQIMKGFMQKGYKLEYAQTILDKAQKPRKIIAVTFLTIFMFSIFSLAIYSNFFSKNKSDLVNPFTGNVIANPNAKQIPLEDVQITPEFINFLLNEIGAWQLHKNPLNFDEPVINSKIGGQTFNSVINGKIQTSPGMNPDADITISLDKATLLSILSAEDQKVTTKMAAQENKIGFKLHASEAELFSKGYLKIYDNFK